MIKSRMRWTERAARMREKRNAYRILVGKQEGKNHWEDQDVWVYNIKMDLRDIGWGGMDWIDLAQGTGAFGGLL
jgi:hypothetical protein